MMNGLYLDVIPLKPLALLWLAYALLGWYLSANHIIWLVGAFVVVLVLAVVWKSVTWLENLASLGSQALSAAIVLSVSVFLIATWSLLLTFVILPLTTTILAAIELRLAGLRERDTLFVLVAIAGLGLAMGEFVDIAFVPSSRY